MADGRMLQEGRKGSQRLAIIAHTWHDYGPKYSKPLE